MKKLITVIFLFLGLFIGIQSNAFAQEKQIKVGAGLVLSSGAIGFDEIDNDIGLRVEGLYPVNDKARITGDFTFFFPKSAGDLDATVFTINFNGNYWLYEKDELSVYGLGGINIAVISLDFPGSNNTPFGDFDDSSTEFGLNLGAGIEYDLDFGDLFGELKFAGVGGDADQLVFGLGVRFPI